MPKSRLITRENAKKKKAEERLSVRNAYGFMDPTPYLAVCNIEREQRRIDGQKKTTRHLNNQNKLIQKETA